MTPTQKSAIKNLVRNYGELIQELLALKILDPHKEVDFLNILEIKSFPNGIEVRNEYPFEISLYPDEFIYTKSLRESDPTAPHFEEFITNILESKVAIKYQPYIQHNDIKFEVHISVARGLKNFKQDLLKITDF